MKLALKRVRGIVIVLLVQLNNSFNCFQDLNYVAYKIFDRAKEIKTYKISIIIYILCKIRFANRFKCPLISRLNTN